MQHNEAYLVTFAQKESKRFKLKTGVFLFLVQNDHILLLRRHKTGIDDGHYVVPMGGVEGGEPLTRAVIREAQEEANIVLNPPDIRVCHVMHRYHVMPQNLSFEQMDVYFYATSYTGIIHNNEPHKCDDLSFFPLNNLPANIAPFIKSAIEHMQKGVVFSEFGW